MNQPETNQKAIKDTKEILAMMLLHPSNHDTKEHLETWAFLIVDTILNPED